MIYVASDHFGFTVKKVVMEWLGRNGMTYQELGSQSETDEQSNAEFIPKVAAAVLERPENRGIMICGTGVGVDIGANRFKGIRSVLAATPKVAEWSRTYDNSNMLCLSGWDANADLVRDILKAWFATPFTDSDGSKNKFLSAMDRWS